jgi:hypothetical protein
VSLAVARARAPSRRIDADADDDDARDASSESLVLYAENVPSSSI